MSTFTVIFLGNKEVDIKANSCKLCNAKEGGVVFNLYDERNRIIATFNWDSMVGFYMKEESNAKE